MDLFAKIAGRRYKLFDYHGHPEAERIIVMMGSGAETATRRWTRWWPPREGGLVKVRLYRPFDLGKFMTALPRTTQHIAVLDRTKEPGSLGEPLYQDVVTALREAEQAHIRPVPPPAHRDRRPLRPLLQGVHAGHGQGRLRRARQARPKRHFTVASTTTSPTSPSRRIPPSTSSRRTWSGPSSTASERTAPSARTRTRSRSSARTRPTSRRATSSTTRRSPGR